MSIPHIGRISVCVTLVLAFTAPAVQAEERPTVKLVPANPGDLAAVEVSGLPKELMARVKAAKPTAKEWQSIFRVVVAGGSPEEVLARTAIAGTYTLTETGVRFEPQYPLVPGREYVAIIYTDPKGKPDLTTVSLPKPPLGPRVSISGVYPSANRLPENTLRFYIHFSGPVARGDVYRHLKLVRDDGVEVKEPFLELPEELWANEGNRLTVFFHPGRVKRGLAPREEDGPILEEGHTYTLSISEKWEDTEGRPIVAGFKKTFTVGPPEDRAVDFENWSLVAPRARSDAPLIVKLSRPLDHALLGRWVWVADSSGKKVPGTLTVGGGERVVTFAPKQPWSKGEYRLVVDTRLEDACGNSVGKAFEVEETDQPAPKTDTSAERKFIVR
jgi:hypothetical protein